MSFLRHNGMQHCFELLSRFEKSRPNGARGNAEQGSDFGVVAVVKETQAENLCLPIGQSADGVSQQTL
jgi:hypothetical protein